MMTTRTCFLSGMAVLGLMGGSASAEPERKQRNYLDMTWWDPYVENSAEELKDAQLHPEKYENLQVRICGWNVRWNDLSRVEQDAYIRRAENVMKGW